MSLTANTEIYTKSIERYKENKTEFIQCTLVDFGKNYAEIDEIEFYDEEFKPISDMLLIPFSKYMEQDDYEEEDDDDNDEFEDISLLNKIINEKIYDADREFKEAFEALMQSDDNIKYFTLMYMPNIEKGIKTKYFKRWLYTKVYPICKENIDNNNDFIIDKKTADKILSVIKTLYSNSEYETAFIITMHYIYFLRTLFVMQVFSDIYHNELAKHIVDTFNIFVAVVYQMKQHCNQKIQDNAAKIILRYLQSFKASSGLSYQDSYMTLLGVFLTDNNAPFNEIIKNIHKHTISTRYLKCAYYHILSKNNKTKAQSYRSKDMTLEEILLLAENYHYFNMTQDIETILQQVKRKADKNSDAVDVYYNILCNTYENSGRTDKLIEVLYERLSDGYSGAFLSLYNEIDHNKSEELNKLIENARQYLNPYEFINELMLLGIYNYLPQFITETSDEKLLYSLAELLIEKRDELRNNIHENEALQDDEIDEIMIESDKKELERFNKCLAQSLHCFDSKEIRKAELKKALDELLYN